MNSFNHYALGSCGQWLFAGVAGIDQAPGSRGYEHVVIAPQINSALTSASATYHSIRGRVECRWRSSVDQLDVFVSIPPNVEASVKLAASPGAVITEAGRPLADANGVRSSDRVGTTCTIAVGSGEYSFTIRNPTSP
jgi:alpha-L-rhamnosidase